ncbi:hypothetical protein LPJ61_006713, partial [Coemansia biformis]
RDLDPDLVLDLAEFMRRVPGVESRDLGSLKDAEAAVAECKEDVEQAWQVIMKL